MPRPILITLTALILVPIAGTREAAFGADVDWPGWRGPGRDGWVRGFQPPARWPERLERVWQVEVGTGYASPVVSGERVFLHARQGEEEVVWRLNLDSGRVEWRQSYAVPFKMGSGGERHGKGPKSSPALADGRLFTMSITGVLSAWDADSGELLWRRDYSSRFEGGHPNWGAATSPLVDGNRVVVHFGTDDRGALIALDTESGDEIWIHGDDGPSYASPILVEIEGTSQIVELTMKGLAGVESESGRLLWEYAYPQVGTNQNMITPAYSGGLLLVGGENRGIRAIEPRRDGSAWTVHDRWYQEEVALNMSSAVVNGDLLYGFSHYDQGRLFALDIKTGNVLWQGPARTGENVALLAMPDHVVALLDGGELKVIAARGDRLRTVASYRVAESDTWTHPVLLAKGILVKDKQTLTLWSLARATGG